MRSLCMLGFLAGCALPVSEFGPVTTDTTATDMGTTATTSTSGTTTTVGTSASSTTASSTTTNDPTTGSPGSTSIVGPDTEGLGDACDLYAQDCPPGLKCAWTAPEGAQYWETTTCVPLVRDPLPDGAPCTYDLDAVFDGVDECGPGAMCVEDYTEVGNWDGQATCHPMCKGSGEYPYCDLGMVCLGGRTMLQCIPICDPFVQDCPVGQRCDLYGPMTLCTLDLPDEPRIDVGKPCEYVQQCELGATCIWAATPACSDSGCCTPFCDLADPQAKCPLPGQQCLAPYDDQVQPGQEWLGVCRTETP